MTKTEEQKNREIHALEKCRQPSHDGRRPKKYTSISSYDFLFDYEFPSVLDVDAPFGGRYQAATSEVVEERGFMGGLNLSPFIYGSLLTRSGKPFRTKIILAVLHTCNHNNLFTHFWLVEREEDEFKGKWVAFDSTYAIHPKFQIVTIIHFTFFGKITSNIDPLVRREIIITPTICPGELIIIICYRYRLPGAAEVINLSSFASSSMINT